MVRNQNRRGLLVAHVAHEGLTPEQSVPDGLHPVGRTHAGAVLAGLYHWEGPHTGAGEQCAEKGAAEMKGYELTAIPIPHPPAWLRAEVAEPGLRLSLGRTSGREQRKVALVLPLLLSILICFSLAIN